MVVGCGVVECQREQREAGGAEAEADQPRLPIRWPNHSWAGMTSSARLPAITALTSDSGAIDIATTWTPQAATATESEREPGRGEQARGAAKRVADVDGRRCDGAAVLAQKRYLGREGAGEREE